MKREEGRLTACSLSKGICTINLLKSPRPVHAFPRFKNDYMISSKIIIVLLFCSYVFSGEGGGLQQEFVLYAS